MKHMRKLASLLLALVMVFALATTAFADGTDSENPSETPSGTPTDTPSTTATYTLTITDTKAGHTYAVYQIFTGDISGTSPNYVLSNVKYGKNYGTEGASVSDATLKAITDADAFAKGYTPSGNAFKTVSSANGSTEISGLPSGYYFVMDSTPVTGQDAATKYILQVVGNTSVAVKSSVPTVEKKVKENVKTVEGNTDTRIPSYTLDTGYNDVADYNMGDDVPFLLIGTLPDNYADYTIYQYIFHDTLSAGLTYNNDAKVYVVNGSSKTEVTESFDTTGSLEVKCTNLKAISGVSITKDSYIVVEYTAKLNSNAVVGLNGNPNKVYLEFSNNHNQEHSGETGTTPEDEVIVFTYKLDVTKVDGTDNTKTLEGAEFKLKNSAGKWATVTDGKVTGWAEAEADGTTLISDANGLFSVTGLDAGIYFLKETKAPTGYNLLANETKLEVIATTANNQTWAGQANTALTALEVKVNDSTTATPGNLTDGSVSMNVENNAGIILPSTGGIGTTIFYVVGSALVIGAAVLLDTKKRKSAEG